VQIAIAADGGSAVASVLADGLPSAFVPGICRAALRRDSASISAVGVESHPRTSGPLRTRMRARAYSLGDRPSGLVSVGGTTLRSAMPIHSGSLPKPRSDEERALRDGDGIDEANVTKTHYTVTGDPCGYTRAIGSARPSPDQCRGLAWSVYLHQSNPRAMSTLLRRTEARSQSGWRPH